MAILTPVNIPAAGRDITAAALTAADVAGDSFANNGNAYLVANNASGAPMDIVADAPNVDNFGFSGDELDVTYTVPAGKTYVFGPFSERRHNAVATGRVSLSYPDGITSLKVAIVTM